MKIKEVLSKNKYYRLEVGKDGKILGGLFRYANTLMKQIDKMDPDYEDTYGDDVMDSIDKLDFALKVPDVNWNGEDKEVVRCAFTKETFNKHKDTIDTLQTALEHFGYQLIKKEVQPDEDAIIYEDKDQIVYWDDMANVKPFLESFANHLDKDILEVIKDNKTTTNYVKQGKCSKTSGFNLLKAYKDPNTKDIKLYVGHLKPTNVDEEYTHIIAHMWIEVDGTVYATNEPKGFDRVIADTLTIDKNKDLYSQVENFLSKPSLNESLTESNNYGYHAGDLGKSEYYGSQSSSRGTGHFGTGTYFVGDPNRIKGYNDYNYGKGEAPHHIVDFSSYNLYKPSTNQNGYDLHDALKVLDGSYTYWKDKVDDVNIVKKYEARDKRNYDKFTEQELEELIGALNRLDSDEPLNYEYISNFLVPENFDKYYDELLLADLDTDGAFDDQYEVQEQLYDKVQEWTDWRVLNAVKDASNIENKLYQALEGRVSMSRIRQGLENVVKTEKQYEANRDKKVDSLATVFMKSLGYEGIDTRHLNKDDKEQALAGLDNTSYGSVIYDVKPNTIVESYEGKTFSLPKELVDKCIDYYKETYPTIKVDKLSVEQLVNDNDLLNDEDLQSYHQRQWDNKSAKEFSINQDKINNMRVSEVPFVVKKKDKLELVDGRHRVRALYNDGYNYVELPVVEESLTEALSQDVDSEGNPLTPEQINFFRNSKVRDSQGKLLVCYHGTDAKFSVFTRGDIGFHFGTEKQAKEILHNRGTKGTIGKYYLNITKYLYYNDDPGQWKGSYLYFNFVSLYDDGLIGEEELPQEDIDELLNCDNLDSFQDLFKNILIANGYDGVVYPNKFEAHDEDGELDLENSEDSFIAFYPNQIKSIDNENPSNSKDINEELKQLQEGSSQDVDSEGNSLTKEQVEFFKNSKVRDSNGRLLVCYHGSKSHFTAFDKSKIKPWGWYGKGFYFTPNQNVASNYSEGHMITCYLNITNPFYADSSFTNKEEYYNRCDKLYELVGITKEEIDEQDEECKYTSDPYYKLLMYLTHTNSSKDINDYVKELGYDGVIGLDAYGGEEQELIIFDSNQVKSIDNKNPSNSDNINEDWLSNAKKTETIKQELNQAYDDLMGNDKTRLYRYREWANNSNNDYKEYIYNDLKKNKDKSLRLWYNTYRLRSGDYDLSYDDFLRKPFKLYRATNVDEKDSVSNPFFSYALTKRLAQRFLSGVFNLDNGRTGDIEEIEVTPSQTLGMFPSDEEEIIIPNKAYQSRVEDMSNIVDNIINYAKENNVKLPYTGEYMLTLFNKRDKENAKKLEAHLINYIDKRRNGSSNNVNEDLEQLHNYIEDNYGTNNLPKASSYILENGKYVDILGRGLEYHGDLDDELVSTFPEDEDIINYVDEDGFIPMNLVKKLFPNIIKMNNGSRDVDSMFIELSDNVPTEEQLDSLIRWALKLPDDNIVIYNHKNNIQAYVPTNKITKKYIKSLYRVKEE